jgi:hypothetical protein
MKRGTLAFSPSNEKWRNQGIGFVASNADTGQKSSVQVSNLLIEKIGSRISAKPQTLNKKKEGQKLGNEFEEECAKFVTATFLKLKSLRPGDWQVRKVNARNDSVLGEFEQYSHLLELGRLAQGNSELRNFLGDSYTVTPDVVIARYPEKEDSINEKERIVDSNTCKLSMLRRSNHDDNHPVPLLHASLSCKFTMRSDRAQNTRTEALNLIRGRKGRTPHIVSVTAEPMPSRIASLALGTGDLDCVYHFALYELIQCLKDLDKDDALDQLRSMISGKRLKDISDLPLDLAV